MSEKKEKKSQGTLMAEQTRSKMNAASDQEREALMAQAMQVIYGKGGGKARVGRR